MSTWQLNTNTETLDLIDFGLINSQLISLNEFAQEIKDIKTKNKINVFNKKASDLMKEYYKLSEEMDVLLDHLLQ